MIGQFFSTFGVGTTGGDVVKIFYVARAVPQRKAAVAFTVIVDRVIGLVALLLFGVALSFTQLPLLFSQHDTRAFTGHVLSLRPRRRGRRPSGAAWARTSCSTGHSLAR